MGSAPADRAFSELPHDRTAGAMTEPAGNGVKSSSATIIREIFEGQLPPQMKRLANDKGNSGINAECHPCDGTAE